MRLGLYGGTFDPVHFGHLLVAERCWEALGLDEVRFIPAGDPPHKERPRAPGSARAEMLAFATAGNPHLLLDRRELNRSGPSYTLETLAEIHDEFPEAELFFLMGADSLADLPHWRAPEKIVELAQIVVANRGGGSWGEESVLRESVGETIADRVRFVRIPGTDFSSTELRARAAAGRSLRYATPAAVWAYIQDRRLYSQEPSE